jgi:hypothetical protein
VRAGSSPKNDNERTSMNESAFWICPACGTAVKTRCCPNCGEDRPSSRDLTLRGVTHQAFSAFTSLDAKVFRTLRVLVVQPGALTNAYVRGPRRPYLGPFTLFLLTNVLFVAMEALTGSNVFATSLRDHLNRQPWSDSAQTLVARHLAANQLTIETYAPVFDKAVAENAKSLIILMTVPFAFLLPLIFKRARLPFAVHLGYSLHFHAFMLTFISAALLIPGISTLLGGVGLKWQLLDNSIAVALLLACTVYLFISAGKVYGATGFERWWKSGVLIIVATGIFLGYRLLLLLLTLRLT